MPDITLIRKPDMELTEADKDAARRVIFGVVDGLGEQGEKQWRRWWNAVFRMEPGDMTNLKTTTKVYGPFQRLHMLIEQRVFRQQDTFEDFKAGFRDWLKTGAGHCDWFPSSTGMFPVPRSTSYESIEDGEFREYHWNAMRFLRSEQAAVTLWPHLPPLDAMNTMDHILREFNR